MTKQKKKLQKKAPLKKSKTKAQPKRSSERVGILGGTFNPMHSGHLNAALTAREKLKLDKVLIIPAHTPPHREISGPSPEDRAALVLACIRPYQPELELNEMEIKRGGLSYLHETLETLNQIYKSENLFFIMGADSFSRFPTWREFEKLLKLANFVVTTRPGTLLSLAREDLPEGFGEFVKTCKPNSLKLTTGREILALELEDIDASSTEIRKKIRSGGDVSKWLPKGEIDLIAQKGFYKRTSPLVSDYREFSKFCSRKALDKKALDLKIYDMTKENAYADYSVICSATSHRHASSLGEGILKAVKEEFGLNPLSIEGMRDGQWVLIDFGAVVVHIFQDAIRAQYKIENLWRRCPQFQNEIEEIRMRQKGTSGKTKSEARSTRP